MSFGYDVYVLTQSIPTTENICLQSADGKYLACGAESGSVYVFDVETSQLVHTLSGIDELIIICTVIFPSLTCNIGHTLAVRALSFAADCRTLISGSDDKRIHVYDVEHGQVAAALTGHNGWVLSVPSNPNISKQQIASSSSDKQVKIWDLGMRQVIETHEVHTDQVWGACWNSEGTKLVSASDDKSIKWFAASGSA
jgi:WD repeat-containing protein 61